MFWEPALTQRFHNCLKTMAYKQKAVALTTLQAVTTPYLHVLHQHPTSNIWHLSSLRGHLDCSIVWVAKQDKIIEAHFSGPRNDCLSFIQMNTTRPPLGACKVKSDLSGAISIDQSKGASNIIQSWELDNFLQRAIENDSINELPEGK